MALHSFYRPHKRVTFKSKLPSRTKQEFQAECDINTIMEKYQKGEVVTHVNRFGGNYGDFTEVQDYQASLNQVMAAQAMFASLPASIRTRFENDPGKFLEFAQDPTKAEEMINLGLATPRPAEPSTEAPAQPATPPPGNTPDPS